MNHGAVHKLRETEKQKKDIHVVCTKHGAHHGRAFGSAARVGVLIESGLSLHMREQILHEALDL